MHTYLLELQGGGVLIGRLGGCKHSCILVCVCVCVCVHAYLMLVSECAHVVSVNRC